MAEINSGRFNRWLQKLFYIQSGGAATVFQVDSAIQAVIPYQNGVEERYLQGWNRFGVFLQAPAVATANASCRVLNPAGSNVIAVVEYVFSHQTTATTGTALQLMIANGLSALSGGTAIPLRIDARTKGGSTLGASFGTSNVSGQILVQRVTGTEATWIANENQEITLAPGDSLEVTDATQNEAIQTSFLWRERSAEPSELT